MQTDRPVVYRHSVTTRITHWLFFIAFLALVSSGLQIFNAAPYLDAADKSDPAHRVLWIDSPQDGTGTTTLFGHTFTTTGFLGWADNGMGARDARAFPGWLTIPAEQSLADGRRWHFFFAWVMVICGIAYIISSVLRRDLPEIILRPSDLSKLLPMQLYYLKLRPDPPVHGKYNPLQKAAYTLVIFVFAPLLVLSGFALSPGFDALFGPLTAAFGGRQFARLWHFVFMAALIGFVLVHVFQVLTQGAYNHVRSMVTGRYRLAKHDGTGI